MENPPFINHFPSYKPPFKTDLPIATFDYRMVFLSMLLFVPASSCCPRSNLSNHFFCAIKKNVCSWSTAPVAGLFSCRFFPACLFIASPTFRLCIHILLLLSPLLLVIQGQNHCFLYSKPTIDIGNNGFLYRIFPMVSWYINKTNRIFTIF